MTWEDLGIDVSKLHRTQNKTRCPKCSDDRRNKRDPSLSVNLQDKTWNCHHCGWHGKLMEREFKPREKEYVKPQWSNTTQLSDKVVKWFADRKISQKTLIECRISEGKEWMPQTQKEENTIQFPYYRTGELINVKYRDGAKRFKLWAGAQLIFWNLDCIAIRNEEIVSAAMQHIKDTGMPQLTYPKLSVVITEGEIDALTVIECGIKEAVSVPNGASKGNNNLSYLDDCIDDFDRADRIILATDNDAPGMALREELIRRLGPERCYVVDFKDCKDANEYAIKYGLLALNECINSATLTPIEGVIEAMEMNDEVTAIYRDGLPSGDSLELPKTLDDNLDDLLKWMPGQFTIITGSPGSGKSEALDFISVRLSVLHDWKFAVFSPENFPTSFHLVKLAEKLIGKSFEGHNKMSRAELDLAMAFIHEHFFFIKPKDENYSLDMILEKATALVKRKGIKGLIIDPWNYLEHQIGNSSETNYVSEQLGKIASFKQRYKVGVFLVAHPRKLQKNKDTRQYEVATLYDIMGSAHFFNKADNGISVYRDFETGKVTFYIQKVKFKWMGKVGMCEWTYDRDCGRYAPYGTNLDRSSYLTGAVQEEIPFKITPNVNAEMSVYRDTAEGTEPMAGPLFLCFNCMENEVSAHGQVCEKCSEA